jgi:microcompartment protein CcmK/EutM
MIVSLFLSLCASGCSQPLEPVFGNLPKGPEFAPPVATDSACRTVSMTLVGSKVVNVTFPDRGSCGSGLVLIPGGTATRNGPGKRNVNLPIRLLNASNYTIESPATVVLPPDGRVVLDPAGQPPSTIIPQNADSVRAGSGEWVWLVGSAGTVLVNDSTAARTLVIRLDTPVTTGQVTVTMEAVQTTAQGWTLVTDNIPAPDTTKLLARPGAQIVFYRTDALIEFESGVSDSAKVAFFAQAGIQVLGVTAPPELFYVRIPDPGTSITVFDAYFDQLNAMPEVLLAVKVEKSGSRPGVDGRFPDDGSTQHRSDWLTGASSTWARRGIRLPYAWGCETGDYGGNPVKIGVLELEHEISHKEFINSAPVLWLP